MEYKSSINIFAYQFMHNLGWNKSELNLPSKHIQINIFLQCKSNQIKSSYLNQIQIFFKLYPIKSSLTFIDYDLIKSFSKLIWIYNFLGIKQNHTHICWLQIEAKCWNTLSHMLYLHQNTSCITYSCQKNTKRLNSLFSIKESLKWLVGGVYYVFLVSCLLVPLLPSKQSPIYRF